MLGSLWEFPRVRLRLQTVIINASSLVNLLSQLLELSFEVNCCRSWARATLARCGRPRWTTSVATRAPFLSPSKGLRQVFPSIIAPFAQIPSNFKKIDLAYLGLAK